MSSACKPRIHWISPLPPAETDIGHYTARILPELAEVAELILWTDAPHWDRALETHCPVRQLDPDTLLPRDFVGLGQGDTLFLHIGNSWVFHSGLLRLAQRLPSIIVLHDLAIQQLCFEAILNQRFDADPYRRAMSFWYGAEGAELADKLLTGQLSATEVARTAPGFEIALDRAMAVLTHTPAAFEASEARHFVPTYQLDLPFRPSPQRSSEERAAEGPLRFVQFGYIGPNRRLEAVLEALSVLRGEVEFRFDIMGNVWDPAHVQARIRALDLVDHVELHGFVAEPALDAALAEAHLVFNLRYPTMGEASGSQLRIWNASAAAAVSDLGWYGSLPDETVFKIRPDEEHADLLRLIRAFAANRDMGAAIGCAGRQCLEARHGPARYAAGIAHIAAQTERDAAAAMLARRARHLLEGMAPNSHISIQRLARQLGS